MTETGGGNDNPLQYSAWKIPWAEEPGRLWVGELDVTEQLHDVTCDNLCRKEQKIV